MAEVKLGKLIEGEAERDAIHIAVVPLVAGVGMMSGQAFRLKEGSNNVAVPSEGSGVMHGIVDPYLGDIDVRKGQRFWGCLFPGTVTGMRHHWSHPAFDGGESPKPTKEESEQWLRRFCWRADCPGFDETMELARSNRRSEYLHVNGMDASGEIPPEFWDHVENLYGVEIPEEDRAIGFSCAC